jgi:hypothetical protein
MLGGFAISLMGVALGAYEWLYFKWWLRRRQPRYFYRESKWWWLPLRLAPWPDQFSPKRSKLGFLVGEALAALLVVLGAVIMVLASV